MRTDVVFEDPAAGLAQRLPPALAPLVRIAYDIAWSWQPGAADLYRAVDPASWASSEGDPLRTLLFASSSALQRAASDSRITEAAKMLDQALEANRARRPAANAPSTDDHPIAYICAEYGLHPSLPLYSGGLGVLAGDYLKQASDGAIPMVGIGLFYRRGYFRQYIDRSGWQHEYAHEAWPDRLPVARALDRAGSPLLIRIPITERDVFAGIWRVTVGRVPLYLLDTDVPENAPVARWITAQLYVPAREMRMLQYAVLGIGAVCALRALGIEPALVHLNEGHAALAALELARPALAAGRSLSDALTDGRKRFVFTTHTPVAAGNESYSAEELMPALRRYLDVLGVSAGELLALGRTAPSDHRQAFGLTQFALRTSASANGVSKRHGQVAREMWQSLYPDRSAADVPITHVTNGVHVPTWMAAPMRDLLRRHLGDQWEEQADRPERWEALESIADEELWRVRCALRARLVSKVRARSTVERLARGEPIAYAEEAAQTFDDQTLTLGFGRRIASYKRLHLLVQNSARALRLLAAPRPVQVVIAGKAHPLDLEAKQLVQLLFALKNEPLAGARVAVLEDYDMGLAADLVAGCDVWINVPRPPLEASGTSGMKAALNGGLHLSVSDGWWCEAFNGSNGWSFDSESGLDAPLEDARDADALYRLLENEVVPLFYDRGADGLPHAWLARVKASMRTIGPAFSMARCLGEYATRLYRSPPAAAQISR